MLSGGGIYAETFEERVVCLTEAEPLFNDDKPLPYYIFGAKLK